MTATLIIMARPTKLNADTSKQIIDALAFGCTRKDAAESAGVWYTTFQDWMKRGAADGKGIFYKFYLSVNKAEAEARKKFTSTIAAAAKDGDWRAALEYLKRRDVEQWGDRQQIEHSGDVRLIKVTVTDDSAD